MPVIDEANVYKTTGPDEEEDLDQLGSGIEAIPELDEFAEGGCIDYVALYFEAKPEKNPRPPLGQETDSWGNAIVTGATLEVLDISEHLCPKCQTYWKPDTPHDCRTTSIIDAIRRLAKDADETHQDTSERLQMLHAWLARVIRQVERHERVITAPEQITIRFEEEDAQRAFGHLVKQVNSTEKRLDRHKEAYEKIQAEIGRLSGALADLKGSRVDLEKAQRDLRKEISLLHRHVGDQDDAIQLLREENAKLRDRVKELDGGLFG